MTEASCIVLQFKLALLVPFGHGVNSWRTNLRTCKQPKARQQRSNNNKNKNKNKKKKKNNNNNYYYYYITT